MSDFNPYELTWPTDECDGTCQGICGYCPKHEKATPTQHGDFFLGPNPKTPSYLRDKEHDDKKTVWISTQFSTYPRIQSHGEGIQYGRGTMKTTVPFDFVFNHENGAMVVPAIAIQNKEQNMFGILQSTLLFTVGCKCWRY